LEGIWDKIYALGAAYGPKILSAAAILILGRLGVAIVNSAIGRLMMSSKVDATLMKFVLSISKIALMTFVVIAALGSLGVQTASFVAIIGAAGLAVGFALQGSLANFASGIMLIIFRPFRSGDFIEAGGTNGSVESIQIFNTILKTPDNKLVIIPNSKITGDKITNYSAMDNRRIDMVFAIGYNNDIRAAKAVLEEIISADQRILKEPAPTIAVLELGESSVNYAVRPWVKTGDYWDVYFDLMERVKLTFDSKGIKIPYPQRDVHIHQVSAA
jgi:small conductance mechanosensitive channel